MHETFEAIQVSSRKIIRGHLRIFFILTSLFLTVLSQKMQVYLLAILIFSQLSYHAAGKNYFKILKIPMYFLLPSLLIILLITGGEELFRFWIFSIGKEGANSAIMTGLRAFASLSILSYLILTTTIPEFISALKKLRLPDFIIEIAVLIYRSIQILLDEAKRLDVAASSRLGYSNRKVFMKTTALLTYSIFLKSLHRAEKMEVSMQARCYNGKMPVREEKNSGWKIVAILTGILLGGWLS
jgi:cobalt/nickel transport system permease protein